MIKKWKGLSGTPVPWAEFQKVGKGIESPRAPAYDGGIKLFLSSRPQLSSARFPETQSLKATIPG